MKILYEQISSKYLPFCLFGMIRLWVWHWTPCFYKGGFDIIGFGWVIMHVSRDQSRRLITIFLEILFGFSTGNFMVYINLGYNLKLQPTWSLPYSYLCARLFEPKQLHRIIFSVVGLNPWTFLKYFIASRIRFYLSTIHQDETSPFTDYNISVKFGWWLKTFSR